MLILRAPAISYVHETICSTAFVQQPLTLNFGNMKLLHSSKVLEKPAGKIVLHNDTTRTLTP